MFAVIIFIVILIMIIGLRCSINTIEGFVRFWLMDETLFFAENWIIRSEKCYTLWSLVGRNVEGQRSV